MNGEISEELKQKCHKLCSQYVWLNITENDLIFKAIIGGITNQMIYCKRRQQLDAIDDKPNEIAIKLYRKSDRPLDANDSILNDMIIGLIISNSGLGPKLYGLATDAVLMQYIQCHQFNRMDQQNQQIVRELGLKLAKVHSMKPPINRRINWFYQTFTEINVNSYKKSEKRELIEENELKYFQSNDFETEFKILKKAIEESDSPIVFSHNDFGFNNILVKNFNQTNGTEERIVLSDFEFSSYGFRGRDLGLVFADWLQFNQLAYHRNCQTIIEPFLESYLNESIGLMGRKYAMNANNCLSHLLYESKLFLLLQYMFSVLYYLNAKQTLFNETKLHILREANHLFGKYLDLKQRLIEENVLKI